MVCYGERMLKADHRAAKESIRRSIALAREVLESRGHRVFSVGQMRNRLIWKEDGEVRTLVIERFHPESDVVRIHVDHYSAVLSMRAAMMLRMTDAPVAQPTRNKAEITVMPDEVEAALTWALSHDSRVGEPKEPMPMPITGKCQKVWEYAWSVRAYDRYFSDARHTSATPASDLASA